MQAVIFSPPKTEDGVPGLWCWPGFIGDVKDVDSCTHNPSLSLSLSLGARVSLANRSSFLITSSSTLFIFFFYFPCSSRINPDVNPPSPGHALFIPVDCGLSKRRHLLSNASLQRALHLDGVTPPAGRRLISPAHSILPICPGLSLSLSLLSSRSRSPVNGSPFSFLLLFSVY